MDPVAPRRVTSSGLTAGSGATTTSASLASYTLIGTLWGDIVASVSAVAVATSSLDGFTGCDVTPVASAITEPVVPPAPSRAVPKRSQSYVTMTAPMNEPISPLARSSSPSPNNRLSSSPPTNDPIEPATSARPQSTPRLVRPSTHWAAAPTTMPKRMMPRINTIGTVSDVGTSRWCVEPIGAFDPSARLRSNPSVNVQREREYKLAGDDRSRAR